MMSFLRRRIICVRSTYVHVGRGDQAAAGGARFDGGDLGVGGRGLLAMRHLFHFICKTKRAVRSTNKQQKKHRDKRRMAAGWTCKARRVSHGGQTQANRSQGPPSVFPHPRT